MTKPQYKHIRSMKIDDSNDDVSSARHDDQSQIKKMT